MATLLTDKIDELVFDLWAGHFHKNDMEGNLSALFCNWIAVSPEKQNIAVGKCTKSDPDEWHRRIIQRTKFPTGRFDSPPKVFIAMTSMYSFVDYSTNLHYPTVKARDITKDDFESVWEHPGSTGRDIGIENSWIAFG